MKKLLQSLCCLLHTAASATSHSSLFSLDSPHLRGGIANKQQKPKSNDVSILTVTLLPFHIRLPFDSDSMSKLLESDNASLRNMIEDTLTSLAIEVFNTTYVGRFQDVEFNYMFQLNTKSAQETELLTIEIRGNATFVSSYYLEDPESEEVTWTLIDEWNDNVGLLEEVFSMFVCDADSDCLESAHAELSYHTEDYALNGGSVSAVEDYSTGSLNWEQMEMDVTNYLTEYQEKSGEDSAFATPVSVTGNEQDVQNVEAVLSSRNSHKAAFNESNPAVWITLTMLIALVTTSSFLIYRRRQSNKDEKEIQQTNVLESSLPSSPSSILKKDAQKTNNMSNKPSNNNATSFNQKSIDQLLQELNDDISLVSDPSKDASTEYSGYSGFSDLNLNQRNVHGTLSLKDAALTSCALHDPKNGETTSATDYLPSTLQKQESFEGKHRTISAMALVLRKDMLHVAGENGENSNETGGSLRTPSPRKSMEMIEQQNKADGKGRVGILPSFDC